MPKTILPVSHRLSARNVATVAQLQAAASREIFPTIDGLVRKVNGEIIPCVNDLAADVTDLETTVTDLEATVAGMGASAQRWVHSTGYNAGASSIRFLNLNGTTGASGTLGVQSQIHLPGTGRLVSVTISSQFAAGVTDVSLYKDGVSVAVVTQTVDIALVNQGYLFDFSGFGALSEWTLGQSLSLSVDPTNFVAEVFVGILWEMDA